MIILRSIFLRLAVIAVSIYLIVCLISVLSKYKSLNKTYKSELRKKQELVDIIDEEKALCDSKSKNKLIEKAARERFGFAYPNEEFYTDISGN